MSRLIVKNLGPEEWRRVKGFANYEVSSLGNVRNRLTFLPSTPLQSRLEPTVILWRDGKAYYALVSTLVMRAFNNGGINE